MTSTDQKNTLFVRNLPPTTAKSDLDSHFGGIGPLRRTTVVTESGTERCKGFAFVTFALQEDAQNALKYLDGSCVLGRKISLDIAKRRQRRDENDIETAATRKTEQREPVKRKGAKKGSVAMRTILLTAVEKDSQLTEEEAKQAVGADNAEAGFESCVMSADAREARCLFSSWALAGRAAAAAHGSKYHAVIEALRGGKRTRLIVRNLPFSIDENELKSRFQSIAPLRELRLAPANLLKVGDSKRRKQADSAIEQESEEDENDKGKDQESSVQSVTVRCGGYAFIEYFLVADAKFSIKKLNGVKIGGRVIAVDLAIGKRAYDAQEQDDVGEGADAGEDENKEAIEDTGEATDADEPEVAGDAAECTALDASPRGKSVVFTGDSEKPTKKAAASTGEELSRTVFVRNLLFETSAPELWKAMEHEFGKVEQAVLVTHPITKRPRGTAFVRFASASSARNAVERAGQGDTSKQDREKDIGLTETPGSDGFLLQGRNLMISNAVDRSKAMDFDSDSRKRRDCDPRNLRLAWIGVVKPDSPEAKGLSKEDLARRAKAMKEKRVKLERNPNVFVSKVRLCVRNLPKDFGEKILKQMFLYAAQEKSPSKSELNRNISGAEREALSPENRDRGKGPHQARIVHLAIARDPQRKDRSKGYGFVQFEQHEDALCALMLLNNNAKAMEWLIQQRPKALKIDTHRERLMRKQWGDGRRLMVEFALEDTRKVQMIERIKERGRTLAEEHKRKRSETPDGSMIGGKRKKQKQDTLVQASRTPSKSEKRAALKRQRATTASNNRKKKKDEQEAQEEDYEVPVQENEKTRRHGGKNSHSDAGSRHRDQDRGFDSIKATERPDPKPKKPRMKRKAAEIEEDNKFDRLLLTYKQKLAKTGTLISENAEDDASSALRRMPRWFE